MATMPGRCRFTRRPRQLRGAERAEWIGRVFDPPHRVAFRAAALRAAIPGGARVRVVGDGHGEASDRFVVQLGHLTGYDPHGARAGADVRAD